MLNALHGHVYLFFGTLLCDIHLKLESPFKRVLFKVEGHNLRCAEPGFFCSLLAWKWCFVLLMEYPSPISRREKTLQWENWLERSCFGKADMWFYSLENERTLFLIFFQRFPWRLSSCWVLLLAQDVVYGMQDVAVVYGMLKVKGSKS